MPSITFHEQDGTSRLCRIDAPTSVMHAALRNDVPGIVGECGGNAMCATCHIYIRENYLDELPEMDEGEDEMLDGTAAPRTDRSRLGCQVVVGHGLEDLEVDIPAAQR